MTVDHLYTGGRVFKVMDGGGATTMAVRDRVVIGS